MIQDMCILGSCCTRAVDLILPLFPMVQDFLSNQYSFRAIPKTMKALVDGAGMKSRSMIITEGSMEPDA